MIIRHFLAITVVAVCLLAEGCNKGVPDEASQVETPRNDSLYMDYVEGPLRQGLGSVESYFRLHFNTLEQWRDTEILNLVCPLEDAITFFQLITGIESKAEHHNVTTYWTKEELEDDYQKWQKWYHVNAESLSEDSVRRVQEFVDSTSNCRPFEP